MAETRSLVKKLCKVMASVGHIPKRGKNKFHNYEYVMEADLVAALRDKMAEQNVFMITSMEEVSAEEKQTKSGGTTAITTARLKATFHDGDSGETLEFWCVGQGEDPADKGVYKAYTGAIKYALMKTFLVPTGDDPEADQETDKRAADGLRGRVRPAPAPPRQQTTSGPPPEEAARNNGHTEWPEKDVQKALAAWHAQLNPVIPDAEDRKDLLRFLWVHKDGALVESTKDIPAAAIRGLAREMAQKKPEDIRAWLATQRPPEDAPAEARVAGGGAK